MFDINSLRTDKTLEVEGVWRDIGGGARLKIARLGNEAFTKMFSELMRPYEESGNEPSEEVKKSFTVSCLAKTILLGWEGIYDGETELDYSYDNAVRALDEIDGFSSLVIRLAQQQDQYKIKRDKEIEGN